MLSLKQVIVNAVHKVSVDPKYYKGEYDTPEDARADFIKGLIAELFPESPEAPASTYVEPEEPKEKKKRAPKAKKENTEAKPEEVKVEVPVVEVKAQEPKEKKKRAPKKEAVKPVEEKTEPIPEVKVEVPVVEVKAEEPKEKKKRAPKKEKEAVPKKEKEPKNVEKLSPTDTKKLKAIAEEFKHEFEKKDILAYLNGLEKSVLDSKSLEEHAREFYAPKTEVEDKECLAVEFKGEEYWVDVTTDPKKVYKTEGDVDVLVGHVGALEFKDMELPIIE